MKDQADSDRDNVGDVCDNCPLVNNTDQYNHDNDERGDACDNDIDDDWIPDETDNCPMIANRGQQDSDDDDIGDACDNCKLSVTRNKLTPTTTTLVTPVMEKRTRMMMGFLMFWTIVSQSPMLTRWTLTRKK